MQAVAELVAAQALPPLLVVGPEARLEREQPERQLPVERELAAELEEAAAAEELRTAPRGRVVRAVAASSCPTA